MSLLLWLIIGAIVGWLGAMIAGRREGLLGSTAIGIVGAFIGRWIGTVFGSGNTSYTSFTWVGFLWSLIGAIILAALLNAFTKNRSKHSHV